ncbi:S53 family peptidase [Aquisphaera insulae]|uniref:S53 family peptidase n=1 Tax=Aquisphaera insulae TaxID=2712864 RepID=UPI0013EAE6AD|nr:S53 family peptidase [Aquisphaera insulae]
MLATTASILDTLIAQPSIGATPLAANLTPTGLSAAQVRNAYGLNQVTFLNGTVVGDGAGQTIAIVSAYDHPTIGSDLKAFDRIMGLPDPPSFVKYYQKATKVDAGWATETALDVEWAHAMAPAANLVLVEAKSATLKDLFNAVNFARSLSGVSVVSMSWGTGEFAGETGYDSLFTTPVGHIGGAGLAGGVAFVAASGDDGAWGGVSYPSTSPNVLSVGGTSIYLGADGSYASETGWRWSTGGYSTYEAAPAYQTSTLVAANLSYGVRATPDVAAIGDPASGVSVYSSVRYQGNSGWFAVGGTSAAAPIWAGLIAVADQGLALSGKGSMGNVAAAVYSLPTSAFNAVVNGFNGYYASSGYDLVTGLGTPVAPRLIADLVASPGGYAGSTSTFRASPNLRFRAAQLHLEIGLGLGGGDSTTGIAAAPVASLTEPVSTVIAPNTLVIVIPVGSGRYVLIVQQVEDLPVPSSTAVHHLDTSPTTAIDEANPGFTNLIRVGQAAPTDSLSALRKARFGDEPDVKSLIDLVPPPLIVPDAPVVPAPADAPILAGTLAPVHLVDRGLSTIGTTPFAPAADEARGAGAKSVEPSAANLRLSTEDGESAAASAPRLAGALAMAGSAGWLAWKGARRNAWSTTGDSSDRLYRPRVRRMRQPIG